jgi:hypothetical protein
MRVLSNDLLFSVSGFVCSLFTSLALPFQFACQPRRFACFRLLIFNTVPCVFIIFDRKSFIERFKIGFASLAKKIRFLVPYFGTVGRCSTPLYITRIALLVNCEIC